jgi:hypothetical protein
LTTTRRGGWHRRHVVKPIELISWLQLRTAVALVLVRLPPCRSRPQSWRPHTKKLHAVGNCTTERVGERLSLCASLRDKYWCVRFAVGQGKVERQSAELGRLQDLQGVVSYRAIERLTAYAAGLLQGTGKRETIQERFLQATLSRCCLPALLLREPAVTHLRLHIVQVRRGTTSAR